jgi:hypothetical protein
VAPNAAEECEMNLRRESLFDGVFVILCVFWINRNTGKHHHDVTGNRESIAPFPKKTEKNRQAMSLGCVGVDRLAEHLAHLSKNPTGDGTFVICLQQVP